MKLWQSQLEGDKLGGEAEETKETEETEEETDESHEEEGGGEDESEKEEHVGDDTNLLKEEEEEEEDAESFGYEKIETSEVEQLDSSSVRNRFESIIMFYSRVVVVGALSQ